MHPRRIQQTHTKVHDCLFCAFYNRSLPAIWLQGSGCGLAAEFYPITSVLHQEMCLPILTWVLHQEMCLPIFSPWAAGQPVMIFITFLANCLLSHCNSADAVDMGDDDASAD
jgi:hypothetical protein